MEACRRTDMGMGDCRDWRDLCSAHVGFKGILGHSGGGSNSGGGGQPADRPELDKQTWEWPWLKEADH